MIEHNSDLATNRQPTPSPAIQGALAALRGKVRRYVVLHGILLAVVWLCLTYWIALALDFLPVLLGFSELSVTTRSVLLIITAAGFGYILVRQVFQRVQKSLHDSSLALLLERKFPEFGDALVTTVQATGDGIPQPVETSAQSQTMLDKARQKAELVLDKTSLNEVFNYRPLVLAGLAALSLMSSVAWFAASHRDAFATGFRRVYLLDENKWPRDCHVQLVGLKVKHSEVVAGIENLNTLTMFDQGTAIVGKASAVSLLVQAELPNELNSRRRLPKTCVVQYQLDNGTRGRLTMNKVGGNRNGLQSFAIDGDVLDGINGTLRFYVKGDDHRIGPFQIEVVDVPVLFDKSIDCFFPEYLVDIESSRFTPRVEKLTAGKKLPVQTRATLLGKCNRPLRSVFVLNAEDEVVQELKFDQPTTVFQKSLGAIRKDIDLRFVLQDVDGVCSTTPSRIRIQALVDAAPKVETYLRGIGSAVTPDALIPVRGSITDDNQVEKAWVELQSPLQDTVSISFPDAAATNRDQIEISVDLRELRNAGVFVSDLPVAVDAIDSGSGNAKPQLVLNVAAKDKYDLGSPNIGSGSVHTLDIVSPARLLRILENDEVAQRRQLEQIVLEMKEARRYIVRSHANGNKSDSRDGSEIVGGFEPGDQPAAENARQSETVDLELSQLFVQRATLQTQKSIQELQALTAAFEDIRLQLVNNRIDAEDRKLRLETKVVEPLNRLVSDSMPTLEQMLLDIDSAFRQRVGTDMATVDFLQQVDQMNMEALVAVDAVLGELQSVLDSLLKLETQNELLDIVRRLLEDQQSLQQRTEALRNREAFDDIFKKQVP